MQSTFLETGYWAIPGPEHNCCLMWGRSRGWEAAGGLTSGQGARGSLGFLRKEGSRQASWDPDGPLELGPKSGPPVILALLSAPRTPLERGERSPSRRGRLGIPGAGLASRPRAVKPRGLGILQE